MTVSPQPETNSPEWAIARNALAESRTTAPDLWQALAQYPIIEIYTDGSYQPDSRGGDGGFGVVLAGFDSPVDTGNWARPVPGALLEIGGYIPARTEPPFPSNNRAEIAAILLAVSCIRALALPQPITIWSDSLTMLQCALGEKQRLSYRDLWAIYDQLTVTNTGTPLEYRMRWLKGHQGGSQLNARADRLAALAGCNFDRDLYAQRYNRKKVKIETGEPAIKLPPPPPKLPNLPDFDPTAEYRMVIHTRGVNRAGMGSYRFWLKEGWSHKANVLYESLDLVTAEYETFYVALSALLTRFGTEAKDAALHRVLIYSHCHPLVNRLSRPFMEHRSPAPPRLSDVQALLASFKGYSIVYMSEDVLRDVF